MFVKKLLSFRNSIYLEQPGLSAKREPKLSSAARFLLSLSLLMLKLKFWFFPFGLKFKSEFNARLLTR